MWVLNANFFGHRFDQDPLVIGTKGWIHEDISWQNRLTAAKETCDLIRKNDSTRPVFNHHGAYTSDIHSLNNYLCLMPLQEREEWLSHYQNFGTLPFMDVEFGTPLENTFLRGRTPFGESIHTEPLFTEFSATYLGKKAYEMETGEYRNQIADYFLGGQEYMSWQDNKINQRLPSHQAIQKLFITNTWRSWRTYGVSGGMLPHMDGHGFMVKEWNDKKVKVCDYKSGRKGSYVEKVPLSMINYWSDKYWVILPGGKALAENNNNTLAYIAGKENDFTEKDHSVREGESFYKQAILISDLRKPVEFEWKCILSIGSQQIDSFSENGVVYPASVNKFPIDFKIPEEISGNKEDGKIVLQARIGEDMHSDTFLFRAFKKPELLNLSIACFDPLGNTKKMLEQLGVKVMPWNGEMDVPQLIIGREVMSDGFKIPGNLSSYVENGGHLMIMAQNPDWMSEKMGFRMSKFVSRYVFPVNINHPVMDGLDEMDLRNWNGKGTLVEAYPDYLNQKVKEGRYGVPYYGWHWGNNGSVSSAAIEKPHKGSWRPILECEFDLAYTPLMELDHGRGRVILNMLDLEDNFNSDPAARKLATNILQYNYTNCHAQKTQNIQYLGSKQGAMFLKEMGLLFETNGKYDQNSGLLIINDNDSINTTELKKYLKNGGRVICLYQEKSKGLFGVNYDISESFHGSIEETDWPELKGISASDTRLRVDCPMWIIKDGCDIESDGLFGKKEIGKGIIYFCQVNPDALNADSLSYLRYSRWRYTRALNQFLSNLGCTFSMDNSVFNYNSEEQFISLEGRWKAKLTHKTPVTISVISSIDDAGISNEAKNLINSEYDKLDLKEYMVPGNMEDYGGEWLNANGEAVFLKKIMLPASYVNKDLVLDLGVIGDYDISYFNGREVGKVDAENDEAWGYERKYIVPAEITKEGENVIAIRVFDVYGKGGILGSENEMRIYPLSNNEENNYYHTDYRNDFKLGDDPFRYFRW